MKYFLMWPEGLSKLVFVPSISPESHPLMYSSYFTAHWHKFEQ
ncbi:MAG TPA: hypothetical protein VFW34_03850 [Candidatus Rubrimentiphilum sp.]|nr:hypothetical protein [Candidatus Rubrimentiphilum sp.]